MIPSSLRTIRALAIDPTSKGFGYAVLEGPSALIDWGVKHVRGERGERNRRCLEKVAALIVRYQPDVLVVERAKAKCCRRWPRALQLIKDIIALGTANRLRIRRISRQRMQECFSEKGSATKYQVATAIAQRFPELASHLPPVRKPWMSEDQRMGIFDALAFGRASYESKRRALSPLSPETSLPHE